MPEPPLGDPVDSDPTPSQPPHHDSVGRSDSASQSDVWEPEGTKRIKLSWTAILCYRRAFSVMCFRRSVQLRGRALAEKGLRLPSCCRAVKMRMTGSISCCRKRTYGLPLQPGVLSQRRSPNRSLVKSGAGCRPSICGWRSSCGGGRLWPNVHQGSHWEVQRRTRCSAFWEDCQAQPHESVWRKTISWCCNQRSPSMVETMQRLDGTLQRTKCAVGLRLQEFWRHYLVRKQKLSRKWMHLWSIV